MAEAKKALADDSLTEQDLRPNHSYLSQLDVTYKTPDLMSHFLPPHEVSTHWVKKETIQDLS
ncbi:hypothetical protein [Streptococcus pneumoniae]|uniref:hypothetical protein n=1 Tax=Streptococcus pneumoniae TaxID=1313 RepID=UPI0039E5C3B3